MSRDVIAPRGGMLLRGLTLWTGVTLVATALPALLEAELATAAGLATGSATTLPFDGLLAVGCALALCACAAWAWLVATATLALAMAGSTRRVPGCPDALRRLVLTAVGVATVAAVAAPAHADPGAGSPPTPDPASAAALPRPDPSPVAAGPAGPPRASAIRVAPGDSLWALARDSLPPAAGHAAVESAWRALWAANREVVGPDPDLIHPGTLLRRPHDHRPTPKEHR